MQKEHQKRNLFNILSLTFWVPVKYFLYCTHFLAWRDSGAASRAEFPVPPSNHVGFTPRLLYSSTHHSPESFTHLKTGLSSRCLTSVIVLELVYPSWHQPLTSKLHPFESKFMPYEDYPRRTFAVHEFEKSTSDGLITQVHMIQEYIDLSIVDGYIYKGT